MIRRFIRIAAATAVISALAMSANAQTALKPLSEADVAEGEALVKDYVDPILAGNTAALRLAATDPAGGCNLAKANEERALTLDSKLKAMRVRLVGEGKTTEGFDEVLAGVGQAVEGVHKTRSALCSTFLNRTGDPVHDEIADKVLKLSTRLAVAMTDAAQADMADDHAGSCLHLREARAAYTDFYAYLQHLRSMIKNGTPDAAKADVNIAKVDTIRVTIEDELKACPAA